MSYIIMCRIYHYVKEPDGGVTEEYDTEEYDGDEYETLEEAEAELAEIRDTCPHAELWISERGD